MVVVVVVVVMHRARTRGKWVFYRSLTYDNHLAPGGASPRPAALPLATYITAHLDIKVNSPTLSDADTSYARDKGRAYPRRIFSAKRTPVRLTSLVLTLERRACAISHMGREVGRALNRGGNFGAGRQGGMFIAPFHDSFADSRNVFISVSFLLSSFVLFNKNVQRFIYIYEIECLSVYVPY